MKRPSETGAESELLAVIPLVARREIEARIVSPLVYAFGEEFGHDRVMELTGHVVAEIAGKQGEHFAKKLGGCTLNHFSACVKAWSAGGSLEISVLEQTEQRLFFDVTRCKYAEFYKALGIEHFGAVLSCSRDFALVQGFNPKIRLRRTQTIMEGASTCDFRFTMGE
jgi:predicted hydrocarbon binding protein